MRKIWVGFLVGVLWLNASPGVTDRISTEPGLTCLVSLPLPTSGFVTDYLLIDSPKDRFQKLCRKGCFAFCPKLTSPELASEFLPLIKKSCLELNGEACRWLVGSKVDFKKEPKLGLAIGRLCLSGDSKACEVAEKFKLPLLEGFNLPSCQGGNPAACLSEIQALGSSKNKYWALMLGCAYGNAEFCDADLVDYMKKNKAEIMSLCQMNPLGPCATAFGQTIDTKTKFLILASQCQNRGGKDCEGYVADLSDYPLAKLWMAVYGCETGSASLCSQLNDIQQATDAWLDERCRQENAEACGIQGELLVKRDFKRGLSLLKKSCRMSQAFDRCFLHGRYLASLGKRKEAKELLKNDCAEANCKSELKSLR